MSDDYKKLATETLKLHRKIQEEMKLNKLPTNTTFLLI